MNFPFYIAKRYLISKKSNNAINIISWISVSAIAVTTASLIIILSAMNGLTSTVASLYNTFEPDLKLSIKKGKNFTLSDAEIKTIKNTSGVKNISFTFSDKALIKNGDHQTLVTVKGVDNNFKYITKIEQSIYDGSFKLNDTSKTNFIILGRGVAEQLGVNIREYVYELSLLSPSKGKENTLNAADNLNQLYCWPGGIFSLNDEFDYQYVFVSLATAQKLFDSQNKSTSVEILCNEGATDKVQKELSSSLPNSYIIKNRYQLNDVLFKTLETEKMATFIILSFILIIAMFNIIGALTMLIIEKQHDLITLFCLGANLKMIRSIFMGEGFLITLIGSLIGLIMGLIICVLQIKFHIVKFGDEFVIPYYPIEMQVGDFVSILLLILVIGFIAALYPVQILTKINLSSKNNG
ncbi:MAG: FtsX-like permease family protein [Bacteroidetes bacterium]|nr:FtsX-like permease family protein [Bacteroidota bacterium]